MSRDNSLTNDQLDELLECYEREWEFSVTDQTAIAHLKEVQDTIPTTIDELSRVCNEYRKRGIFEDVSARFNALLRKIYHCNHWIQQYDMLTIYDDPSRDMKDVDILYKFSPIKFDTLRPFQKLVLKMFDVFEAKQYKKRGTTIYSQIRNPYETHSWKVVGTILDVIHMECTMCKDYENWLMMTSSKDLDKQLSNYFERTTDYRLSTLKKNRNMFSFSNGIYFSVYETDMLTDKFICYGSTEHIALSHHEASAKYFAFEFLHGDETNPRNIHTPFLDSVYQYQMLTPDVIEINKMFIGRMLYDVEQLDCWQVIMMLLGSGGSGKSTIHNVVRMFYDFEDVGVMGNNYQKLFGLADIYDKFIFIAPEIKRDWGIDQAEFQEIVSGGKVNVNIKHKDSIRVSWKAPGMLAGNENPGFVDNASSIQRRVVVTRFNHKVQQGDPHLAKKLEGEIGKILKQCNLIYLQYVREKKAEDIWKWLPPYFIQTQTMMACASNALNAFLHSDHVRLDSSLFVPMEDFFRHFNFFCTEHNFKRPNINVDMYSAPFEKVRIEVIPKGTHTYRGRVFKNIRILKGVDLSHVEEDGEMVVDDPI